MNHPQPQNELPSNDVALELTPGRLLAAARSEQHLTIADVANRLKLSVSQVEALENDAYDRLPGPVFVRGFMRNYARLVKVDSERLMSTGTMPSLASDSREAPEEPLELPLRDERRWPRYVAVAAVIFVLAAVIDFLWPEADTRVASSGAPTALQPSPPAEAPPAAVLPADSGAAAVTPEGAAPVNAATVSDNRGGAGPLATASTASRDAQAAAPTPAQLRLMFTERSWVEIRDRNGHVILSQLNGPGTTRELNGAAPLKLVIGNARGVHVIYNERPVDLAKYIHVDVARLTLE